MGLIFRDVNDLAGKLSRLSHVRFEAVIMKNMAQIYNRGKADGGTPVDTGELRLSLGHSGDTVGYTKSYAPHVEYGHRTVNGGYVQGQRFLQRNVKQQEPIYRQDLIDQLKKL
ncbi:hypothetical protein [Paratractidigestivibacter sp.]|uniref:hypothetical protein n=1 Tax=Paratractidigestivibacter sp. TaxID=2847316 RepID=UPI002AC99F72|nr:hypothetical protein [Paratractidigestivibacter sp.]